MTTPSIEEVARRVEAATGPDYDLEVEIWRLAFGHPDDDEPAEDPMYTASLDAAMTLIDQPFSHCEVYPPQGRHTNWTVHIIPPERGIANTRTGYAATYALALTAAALRARAHLTVGATHDR